VEESSRLGQRPPPGGGHLAEHRGGTLGLSAHQVLGRGGLHHHRADRVGDHVVQLAGDPLPFRADCLAANPLLLPRQLLALLGQAPCEPA
jgi:hypothetical protein